MKIDSDEWRAGIFKSNVTLPPNFLIIAAVAAYMSFTVCVFAPRSNADHTMTVLSKLAEASHCISGLNTTVLIGGIFNASG